MIRHYLNTENSHVSARYSYEGISSDTILIKKFTRSNPNESVQRETIRIPIEGSTGPKEARLQVGSHTVKLKLNKYDRIIVREIK